MADELQMPAKELTQHMAVATELMLEHLTNGEDIAIPGFGTLEVRKKNERLIVQSGEQNKDTCSTQIGTLFQTKSCNKREI